MTLRRAHTKHVANMRSNPHGGWPGKYCLMLLVVLLGWWPIATVAQEEGESLTTEEIRDLTENEEIPANDGGDQPDESESYILQTDTQAGDSDVVQFAERPEDTLFILELVLGDGSVLNPGMLVYIEEDELLIPLSTIADAMMFPIEVDTAKGSATGWFINQENTFALTYPFNSVMIAGQEMPIDGVVENHVEDIFVSATVLEQWFPVELTMNFNELRLYLKALEDLPFQSLAARRTRWEKAQMQTSTSRVDLSDPEIIFLPYHMFAAPNIQVQHNLSANKMGSETTGALTNSVQTQGDLLGMLNRFNASTSYRSQDSEVSLDNTYFNLSRRDFRGGLLGPMNATEVELGDITANAFPLATGLQQGRGAYVSNAPSTFVRDTSQFFIEGFAPQGWDAEVYLNERLLDFQTVGADGRYLFEDLQLRDGFNLFRIVLYGPNGEQEERFERFYLGRNMVEPGEFVYEVSALQSSTPFFNALQTNPLDDTDPTLSLYGEYGITDRLSWHAGYFYGPDGVDTLNAVGTGARISTDRAYIQLNTLADASGAYSASVDVTGNVTDNITFIAGHVEHDGFQRSQRNVSQRTFLSFNRPFSIRGLVEYGAVTLGAEREVSDTGVVTNSINNVISGNIGQFSVTNDMEYQMRDVALNNEELEGDLTVRRRTRIGTFRGRISYDLLDEEDVLNTAELLYQTQISRDTYANFGINTSFVGNQETRFSTSVNRRFEEFILSANAAVTDTGDANVGLGLSYNFIPQSLSGDYFLSGNPGDMSLGQLQLHSFLDTNENGVFDEGEPPISGVEMRNMQRGKRGITDEQGNTTLAGLSPNVVNPIRVKPETIPSIYMTPAKDELKVYGRTGVNGPVDYPFILLGEISGMLYTVDPAAATPEERIVPMAGTEIFLLDENEDVVAQTYSEYDGFYIIPSLRMGTYQLYLPPSAALSEKHNGEGLGPVVTLSQEKTEAFDTNMLVLPNQIVSPDSVDPTDALMPIPLIEQQQAQMDEEEVADEEEAQEVARIMPQPLPEATKAPVIPVTTPDVAETSKPSKHRAPLIDAEEPLYVQVGHFCNRINAQKQYETLLIAGYPAVMKPQGRQNGECYSVQAGPTSALALVMVIKDHLEHLGFKLPFVKN